MKKIFKKLLKIRLAIDVKAGDYIHECEEGHICGLVKSVKIKGLIIYLEMDHHSDKNNHGTPVFIDRRMLITRGVSQ